ncbi:hypothetical protein KMP11_03245 [Gemella sp. zg-570]|uniref:hypothetical protein n=1 Tax=Gemella sp. zg-570 TaxID=2840371 RepID=UPI001C0D7A95|nr:hypothetical protein [Gemella sp. zg-570]QWQ39354.1 hypothetical protein KMP11_03245 [Gemella sp. zg-570]
MTLQFKEFRKKIARKKYLDLDFTLEENSSLTIINDNDKVLELIKKVFKRNLRYDGKVFINDKDIKKIKNYYPYFKNNIGFYNNFSLYQNLKTSLSLFKIKYTKKQILEILSLANLDYKSNYAKLDLSSKEKFSILFSSLVSQKIFIVDITDTKLNVKDMAYITSFLKKEIAKNNRNIVILSKKLNDLALLCEKTLVISEDKQVYFDDTNKLSVIKDLVVLEITDYKEEDLYKDLHFDFKTIDKKLIIRRDNLEDALYYFVKSNIEVLNISDFNEDADLYEVEE